MTYLDATIRHLKECGSTNDTAREWARDVLDPAADGAMVTADFQTSGRGRRGRVWQSLAGDNALMSIVLRPPYPFEDAWRLAFVAALAVSDAVAEFGVFPHLKWPNDILVEARKVSGILVETETASHHPYPPERRPSGWAAIVGIGVNVNQAAFGSEAEYDISPISLRMAIGDEISVDTVRRAVHRCLLAREDQHRQEGFAVIVEEWRARMAAGYEIKRGASRGVQSLLLDDGRLRVVLPDGTFAVWGTIDE